MAQHQNEFSRSSFGDAIERLDEIVYLRLASIEFFQDSSLSRTSRARWGTRRFVGLSPKNQARAQIRFEARRGLKPMLSRISQQLQDDGLDRAGNPLDPLAWRSGVGLCGNGSIPADRIQRTGAIW